MIKILQHTAMMQKVLVFNNEIRIGYGFIFYRDDGRMVGPELYYDNGEKLPTGLYNLLATDEVNLVVIPKGKQ